MEDDPKSIVEYLIASGMTQEEIVAALKKGGVEASQATISRILRGTTKRTSFDVGLGLLRLHAQVRCAQSPPKRS